MVGCGLNVNQDPAQLEAIGRSATSLKAEAGRSFHRGELLVVCLERFESWLSQDRGRRLAGLRLEWERRLWGRGERVRLRDQNLEFSAVLEGVAADGSLLARLDSGEARRILAGEIVL